MKAISAILALACGACADNTDRDPVVADLKQLTLRIPRDQEFTQIHLSDKDARGQPLNRRSVSFEICDQHVADIPDAACELHGRFGTWVLVQQAPAGAEFSILKERPLYPEPPRTAELLPVSGDDQRNIHYPSAQAAEASALLRVRSKIWGDDPQQSTTDFGWPVADCDRHPHGGIGCRFGFLIDGTPVIAQWFSPGDQKDITQAQVWDLASDVDRRVRRLVVSSGAKPS